MKRKSDRIREGAADDEVRVLVEENGKQQEKERDHEEKHEEVTEVEREEKEGYR